MSTTTPTNDAADTFLGAGPKQLLIDGQWVDSVTGARFASINPSTAQTIAELAEGDGPDVDLAVAAARRALSGPWRSMTPVRRQALMLALANAITAHFEELRVLEAVDMGFPIGRSPASGAEHAVQVLRYFAGWTTKIQGDTLPNSMPFPVLTYTLKEPVGVVASIIPWNSPISNVLWKLAPVLASGCTMVLKPAEEASLVALRIGELLTDLDPPPGVVNIVTGFGETVGAALTAHPDVDKVAFTGSTAVGQQIVRAAAGNLKRVTLELGGKSPDIVFADADLSQAVPGAAMGVFANSGQACCAGTRIFVERSVHDAFVEAAVELAGNLRVGHSLDPATRIGPVVSDEQFRRVTGYLDIGRDEGATAAVGGGPVDVDGLPDGYFVAPTIFTDVEDDMRIAREEIFGPVACVMPFDSIDEVITRSNDTPFGLAGGVWTRDVGTAHRVARELRTGTVWVNTYNLFDPVVPFGGFGMSGWGHECGPDAIDEYLNTKAVWVRTE